MLQRRGCPVSGGLPAGAHAPARVTARIGYLTDRQTHTHTHRDSATAQKQTTGQCAARGQRHTRQQTGSTRTAARPASTQASAQHTDSSAHGNTEQAGPVQPQNQSNHSASLSTTTVTTGSLGQHSTRACTAACGLGRALGLRAGTPASSAFLHNFLIPLLVISLTFRECPYGF